MPPLARLPVALPPARHEILTSYIARLAAVHGMNERELWSSLTTTASTQTTRVISGQRLAALTGYPLTTLARALPELHHRPSWELFRDAAQTGCPRCAARHRGVVRVVLPHHRYVCVRHRCWIGPPDLDPRPADLQALPEVVTAQHRHLRLLHRRGWLRTYDALLRTLRLCAHLWCLGPDSNTDAWHEWERRVDVLIPPAVVPHVFSVSRLYAAIYPEAVGVAALFAAAGPARRADLAAQIRCRLGHEDPDHPHRDAVGRWLDREPYDQPCRPPQTFPQAIEPTRADARQARHRRERDAYTYLLHKTAAKILILDRHLNPGHATPQQPSSATDPAHPRSTP